MDAYEAAKNATVDAGLSRTGVKLYRSHGNVNGNRRSLGRTIKLINKHRAGECGCNLQYDQRC